jgi:putative MATE family efflux protein
MAQAAPTDLTQGSITAHLVRMAVPIAVGMLFQTLYVLVDLYFVAGLGDYAVAGVGAAGNLAFVVLALTQVLGVATVALIGQAVGRRDLADANLVFNQSLAMALALFVVTLVLGYALLGPYMAMFGADGATAAAGREYLAWYLPGLALQFALVSTGSALRGTGIVKPTMVVQLATVILNAVLAPVLIAGVGTGIALGVAGAGLSSTISIAVGVVLMWRYFARLEHVVRLSADLLAPRPAQWRRLLRIGLPAGGEFALMFVYSAVVYWTIRRFGADAQAGFNIGVRVMQAIFLPAIALAFATAPVAAQNVGAGLAARVRESFRTSALLGSALMIVLTLLCQLRPELLVGGFSRDAEVIAVGAGYLRFVSWNFVASTLVFTCSSLFQAFGNTMPSLFSSGTRLLSFALPALWLAQQPDFRIEQLWILSVATISLQAVMSLWLLRREFRRRLAPAA